MKNSMVIFLVFFMVSCNDNEPECDCIENKNYGSVFIEESKPEILIFDENDNSPKKVEGLNEGYLQGFNYFDSGLIFTDDTSAFFIISLSSSLSFSDVSTDINGNIYINEDKTSIGFHRTISRSGSLGSVSMSGVVELSKGDSVQMLLYPTRHSGVDNLLIKSLSLILYEL